MELEDSSSTFTEKYVVSCGNYEGGLLGLSFSSFDQIQEDLGTEYAFNATQVRNHALAHNFHKGFHQRNRRKQQLAGTGRLLRNH